MSSILVIEDEGFIAGILKNIVGREGYRTVMARTVEDAVRFALREVPCLIVVDLEAADISLAEYCASNDEYFVALTKQSPAPSWLI